MRSLQGISESRALCIKTLRHVLCVELCPSRFRSIQRLGRTGPLSISLYPVSLCSVAPPRGASPPRHLAPQSHPHLPHLPHVGPESWAQALLHLASAWYPCTLFIFITCTSNLFAPPSPLQVVEGLVGEFRELSAHRSATLPQNRVWVFHFIRSVLQPPVWSLTTCHRKLPRG